MYTIQTQEYVRILFMSDKCLKSWNHWNILLLFTGLTCNASLSGHLHYEHVLVGAENASASYKIGLRIK